MLAPRLVAWFEDYADGHRHPTNRLTHIVAIPVIVFHILAMLDWVSLVAIPGVGTLTLAHVAWVVSVGWYLTLDRKLGAWMGLLYGLCIPLGWVTPRVVVGVLAVLGWGIQLAGHTIWEKNRPSFVQNLGHALIGPMFFLAKLTGDWAPDAAAGARQGHT